MLVQEKLGKTAQEEGLSPDIYCPPPSSHHSAIWKPRIVLAEKEFASFSSKPLILE